MNKQQGIDRFSACGDEYVEVRQLLSNAMVMGNVSGIQNRQVKKQIRLSTYVYHVKMIANHCNAIYYTNI